MPLLRDPWALWPALLGLAINLTLLLVLLARLPELPDLIPVHFNVFGEPDLIDDKRSILRLPVVSTLVWAGNLAVAFLADRLDRILARLLLAAGVVVAVLFVLTAFRLIA